MPTQNYPRRRARRFGSFSRSAARSRCVPSSNQDDEGVDVSERRVVVIGAGAAGLACAAELERKGIRAVVLERAEAIGSSWRGRYDRLRLNSSRWFSKLPDGPFPSGTGVFPSRDEMMSYLQ